jgi:hypothetical protein
MTSPTPIRDELVRELKKDHRSTLNERLHFVPLDLESLKISLNNVIQQAKEDLIPDEQSMDGYDQYIISLDNFRETIIEGVFKNTPNHIKGILKCEFSIVIHGSRVTVNGIDLLSLAGPNIIKDYTPAVVYMGQETTANIVGALYKNYDATRGSLFGEFLNKQLNKFIKKSFYKEGGSKYNYTRRFNVGHTTGIFTKDEKGNLDLDKQIANTPLELKIAHTIAKLQEKINTVSDPSKNAQLKNTLAKVQGEFDKFLQGHSYGKKLSVTLHKDVGDFLFLVGANVVIIQDEFENQFTFSQLFEGPAGKKILGYMIEVNFSKNILEELASRIGARLLGKSTPSSRSKLKLKDINIAQNPKITLMQGAASRSISSPSSSIQRTQVRTPSGQFHSLVTLQTLINSLLAKTIKENMGTGGRRDILNLRTGRFAESVRVERLSESREGMITAFYTYMRNPYGTFSAGGRQEYPKSRDPKLLISKSIREIAETQVKNRLRAVLV